MPSSSLPSRRQTAVRDSDRLPSDATQRDELDAGLKIGGGALLKTDRGPAGSGLMLMQATAFVAPLSGEPLPDFGLLRRKSRRETARRRQRSSLLLRNSKPTLVLFSPPHSGDSTWAMLCRASACVKASWVWVVLSADRAGWRRPIAQRRRGTLQPRTAEVQDAPPRPAVRPVRRRTSGRLTSEMQARLAPKRGSCPDCGRRRGDVQKHGCVEISKSKARDAVLLEVQLRRTPLRFEPDTARRGTRLVILYAA